MSIQDAINSGKRFRRPSFVFWGIAPAWIEVVDGGLGDKRKLIWSHNDEKCMLDVDDLLAEDWITE